MKPLSTNENNKSLAINFMLQHRDHILNGLTSPDTGVIPWSKVSLVPRPRFPTAAGGLHHRYVESGIVPRPRFPTAAGGLHHRYVESSGDVIHPQLLGIWVWGRD